MLVQHSKHSLTKHMNYCIRITEILSSFKKFTYPWHTRIATAISDQNNEQHIHK